MPFDPINISLTALQDIMDDLPENPDGERRRNNLTRDDVLIIARVVQAVSHERCAMGFTPEEITRIKSVMNILNKGILAIGYSVLAAIGAALVSAVIWSVKHGILEAAQTTKQGVGK